jgi:hypothetical protein
VYTRYVFTSVETVIKTACICRLKREETPSFFIYQDWALGLLFLKMGLRGLDNLFPALPRPQEDAQYEMPCLQPLKLLCARYRLLIAAGLSQVGNDSFS